MSNRNLPVLRAEATAVLCTICPDPGRCCRWFCFHKSFWTDLGLASAQLRLVAENIPFIIEEWSETNKDENGREYANVMCSCPKVTAEGLCSIYEDRPATCRRYAPGSDRLCVFNGSSGIKFHQPRDFDEDNKSPDDQ